MSAKTLTVILLDNGEPNVVLYTWELVSRQLSEIPNTEIIIENKLSDGLKKSDSDYVCVLESDCLLSEKYFIYLLNYIKRYEANNVSVVSPVTAVLRWNNRFFGYYNDILKTTGSSSAIIYPQKDFKSFKPYPIQIAYLPGSLVRRKLFQKDDVENDMVGLSVELSKRAWEDGDRVCLHPKPVYVTTEESAGVPYRFPGVGDELKKIFERQLV